MATIVESSRKRFKEVYTWASLNLHRLLIGFDFGHFKSNLGYPYKQPSTTREETRASYHSFEVIPELL